MSQKLIFLLVVGYLTAGCPVWADSGGSAAEASLAKRSMGLVVGALVGFPICVFRKPIEEEKFGIRSMTGSSNNKRVTIPAAMLYLPIALVSGVLESPASAVVNSWKHADQPFSKEQFSLGSSKQD
jgi:hypothetical protein